jgi:hypothetical protein
MRLDSFEAHKNLIFLNLEECVALLLDVAVHGSSIVGQGRAMSKFNSGIFAVTGDRGWVMEKIQSLIY